MKRKLFLFLLFCCLLTASTVAGGGYLNVEDLLKFSTYDPPSANHTEAQVRNWAKQIEK